MLCTGAESFTKENPWKVFSSEPIWACRSQASGDTEEGEWEERGEGVGGMVSVVESRYEM
jgi:hypothetical protein